MKPLEITIEEDKTIYDVSMEYHSDLMCENYDAIVQAVEEADGCISFYPVYEKSKSKYPFLDFPKDDESFTFIHSDPDRVIAIANMMKAFAEMVKKQSKTSIDIPKAE